MSVHPVTPEIASLLRTAGVEVADDAGTRARYSSDASLYRIPPRAVVLPRHADEVEAVLDLCRGARVPVTARVTHTIVRGNVVARDGRVMGEPEGRDVRRS